MKDKNRKAMYAKEKNVLPLKSKKWEDMNQRERFDSNHKVFEEIRQDTDEFIKQNPNASETYHIIHPVLKHIAILSCL